MKLLLKEKVEKLGEIGEVVSVKPGYARNFLLPNNLAAIPTPGEIKRIQKKKELLEKQYQEEKLQAEGIAKQLGEIAKIEMNAEAGEAGKLFGRITAKDIVERLNSQLGIEINKKSILLKKAISELGEFDIKIKLHNEVTAEIKLIVKKTE
ncbi:MAG: 50S ribosomal protein L9 [Candidatus Melainabacteria bacterium RIFCSPLOWO2_02_FULL_35_15]|nr:MAG: 50S ribosomal protein L9 [Candidatus Melainabacteria bacterium RIFCSPLOWO2_12_FULL_35_11]OGI14605.1 MAG: 50S ribosomal protein L9 [Candidatus Melainabacteria bacterium RIFCSPLOWO2_02_FULL_35_15]